MQADALAVRQDRILAVGAYEHVRKLVDASATHIDLQGRCVLPGFHDSHVHLTQHGFELTQVNLSEARTLEEGLALVRAYAQDLAPGTWVLGAGFLMSRWGVSSLDKHMLDAVAPQHPVLLRSQDHHSAWVNSLALERAGVTAQTQDPPDGEIVRLENNEPSGLLLEQALHLVWDAVPAPDAPAIKQALQQAGEHFASLGVTTVHHMAYEPAAYWQQLASLASSEDYALRVWACLPQEDAEHAAAIGVATGQGGRHFQVGGAKFFADGALGSMTAHMLEPYEGSTSTGVSVHGREILQERIPKVIQAGLVPVVHAIGDAANRTVLDVLTQTKDLWQSKHMRPRIEHVQHVHPDDVARFAELGVIASVQPIHLRFDAKRTRELLADRAMHAHPWRDLLQHGTTLALGSDTPVASPDVLLNLHTAVTRESEEGDVLNASQRLSINEALSAYTKDAAYAIGWEARSGQLKAGYDADMVILSHNPLESLENLVVMATMKAGRWTFQREGI